MPSSRTFSGSSSSSRTDDGGGRLCTTACQLTSLQAQDTALSKFGTDLASLSTALQSLTDFNGVFASKQGSSSDTSVVALASASNVAAAGSHTIVVNNRYLGLNLKSPLVAGAGPITGQVDNIRRLEDLGVGCCLLAR